MNRRISIADVARHANVSIATVSRVINATGYPISPEVRIRVQAAIEALEYTPSLAAQRLRSDFNNVIGLITRDISNSFFGEIAKGATERAMELGHLSFICNTGRNPANEMEFHELLWKNRVRGIILIGGGFDTTEYHNLLRRQVERCKRFGLKLVANTPQGTELPTVSVDLAAIAAQMTQYLVDHGHRTIGLITGEQGVLTSKGHLSGYSTVLENRGLPFHQGLVRLQAFTEECGYTGCNELLNHSPRPTAICCGCDPIATGVLHALHDAGMSVPGDVSLISIGDTPIACHLRPALTSIRVPRYRMGARAVELILANEPDMRHTELLPTEFIVRDSVRDIR
jgi:LacI family transcriptional regulator